ncbi:MAG: PA14 domain-containing protein, partial [bacterium]
MKSKVSIQKSFIYAVTVVAILAVVVGVVLRFTSVSADTPASSNADAVSDCYRDGSMKGWYSTTQCSEKMAVACTRTKSLATKTAATPTDQEKATFGEKVKAWNIVINKANPQGKFRLVMGAKRTSTVTVSRIDFGLTPLGRNWGGNGDRIYLIFGDGMGYKKVYNYIALNTTWTSYINRTGLTGDVDVMFVGKNEDGCLEGVLDLPTALVTPTPSPSPSPSASIPPLDPNLVDGLRGCYYNGKSFDAYIGPRTENVNFIWGRGPAVVNGSFDHFSVRWEGMVVPKYTETYKFKVNYDDAVRLWIGGKQYINDWNNNTTTQTKEASVTLQAGVPVSLRLEYFENTSDASVQLYWSSSGQKEQIIPVADLKHDKNYQCAAGTVTATPVPSPSPTPSVTVSVLASITPNLIDGLQGCYYNGKSFDTYLKTRSENIQFNWGIGTPFNTVIDKDNFSAR